MLTHLDVQAVRTGAACLFASLPRNGRGLVVAATDAALGSDLSLLVDKNHGGVLSSSGEADTADTEEAGSDGWGG